MQGPITPKRFHEADWQVIRESASVSFRTGSLAEGVAFVNEITGMAGSLDDHLDVDLRPNGVTVRLRQNDVGELSEDDVALAGRISASARTMGLPIDPTGMQTIQVAIDALVIPDVMPFWRAVLGYEVLGDEDLFDPHFQGPPFWFQQMDAPRPQRNRIHIDLYLPEDQAEARVAAALAAGGHLVSDEHAPQWWTLADAGGNEVDVAPWPDQG
jgi:4a-hydroxytetrahydrobiopterin dehydratase